MKYIDLRGDSLTLHGERDLLNRVSNVHKDNLDRYYTFSLDANGKASLSATNKDRTNDPLGFTRAEAYFNELNSVVNGEGMAHIRIVENSENALFGNFNDGMIDIGDIEHLPKSGEILSQGSIMIHETVEQYHSQVVNPDSTFLQSHRVATEAESRVLGVLMEPNREQNTIGRSGATSGFLSVFTIDRQRTQYIYYRYNNITNVGNLIGNLIRR